MDKDMICPKCGSKNTVPIIYGLPSLDLYEKEQKREILLGGCCVTSDAPCCYCKDCGNRWGNYSEYVDKQRQELLKRFEKHKEE